MLAWQHVKYDIITVCIYCEGLCLIRARLPPKAMTELVRGLKHHELLCLEPR